MGFESFTREKLLRIHYKNKGENIMSNQKEVAKDVPNISATSTYN
jgi:hypothetical protein